MASRRKPRTRISYVLPLANSPGGHRLGVNSLALDEENSILYSGGRDGILCAWEVDTSRKEKPHTQFSRQIHAHTHWVNDILLADSKKALVSASSDITVKVWRPFSEDSNSATDIGKHNDYVKCLASPGVHSDWVASGGLDQTVRIWDLNGAGEKFSIDTKDDESKEKGSVYALSARTSIVASGGPDSILRLWDPRTGKRITKFVGHTDNVRSILINETGDMVMTASSDQTVKVWSVTAGRCISTLTMHNDSVWSLCSNHPQLSIFYSADRSGIIAKTDVRESENMDGGLSIAVAQEHGGVAKLVAGGGSIWSATASSSINRWDDIDTEDPLESAETPAQHRVLNLVSRIRTVKTESTAGGQNIPLSCILKLSNVVPQTFREFDDIGGTGSMRRMSEAPVDPDEEDEMVPYHNLPFETIEGQNGLIKHEILNDRKRVLTLDTAGEVVLWDLIRCVPIKSFGKTHMENVRHQVDTMESVAKWCTVATKAGSLTVALEENDCFDAEVYADEANIEAVDEFKDDGRINLGKWVLRYLFAGLIDEEIRRDGDYRKELEASKPADAPGLDLGSLPPRQLDSVNGILEDSESITTPKAATNGVPATTPGLSIGLASPGLTQVTSNTNFGSTKTPGTAEDRSRLSGDYFSNKPPPAAPNVKGTDATAETTSTPAETATSPNDADEKSKSPSLFGKKFRLPLKKLGRTSAETPTKPVVVEEKPEESDKASEKEETPIEENMYGVLQRIKLEYDQHLQHYPGDPLRSAVIPSLPTETPVINPPTLTSILIQQDAPESGGLADLYRGTVASVGKDADKIEKVAPPWLGELLLRNQTPLKEIAKVSFILYPYNDLLPPIATEGNARLNANRMLRAKKIVSYVTDRIDPDGTNEENSLKPEDYIELYCNDQLVAPNLTLATLKAHIWRSGGDVILYYKGNGKKPHLEANWVKEKARLAEEAEKAAAQAQTDGEKSIDEQDKTSSRSTEA